MRAETASLAVGAPLGAPNPSVISIGIEYGPVELFGLLPVGHYSNRFRFRLRLWPPRHFSLASTAVSSRIGKMGRARTT